MKNPYIPSDNYRNIIRTQSIEKLKDDSTVSINFQPGGFGHFLEAICNIAGGFYQFNYSIFNSVSNAHNTSFDDDYLYSPTRKFFKGHYFQLQNIYNTISNRKRSIEIIVDPSDRFLFYVGAYKRTTGIDWFDIDKDTYSKLNKPHTWAELKCLQMHEPEFGKTIFELPKVMLTDFFRGQFRIEPWDILETQKNYIKNNDISLRFSFNNFFSKDKFLNGIKDIFEFVGYDITNYNGISDLYDEFAKRHETLVKSFETCNTVVNNTVNGINSNIQLNSCQQGYILAELEKKYNIDEIHDISEEMFYNLPSVIKGYINDPKQ